jgi:CRISPR-associated protein Cmr4
MAKLVAHGSTRSRLRGQLVVVSDRTFCYFATNALPVVAHNQLNDKTKASQNLWFEETLPPDTLLYTVLAVRDPDRALLDDLQGRVRARPYLRVGANETVGQGWCIVQPLEDSHG